MFFFNRTTIKVFVTYITAALYVHPWLQHHIECFNRLAQNLPSWFLSGQTSLYSFIEYAVWYVGVGITVQCGLSHNDRFYWEITECCRVCCETVRGTRATIHVIRDKIAQILHWRLNSIIVSSTCFDHPSVHSQEDLYVKYIQGCR